MVNTPFFKAGIAGDGAYNRTLTPLGFQTERRDLWEAPNVYLDMSPFLKANQLTGALLMYHGMHDQNVGTDPINSMRLFHALNGLGKTVALYRYPFEDHGPAGARDAARPVVALGRVARQVREEPAAASETRRRAHAGWRKGRRAVDRFKVQGSRFKVQGSGSRFKVQRRLRSRGSGECRNSGPHRFSGLSHDIARLGLLSCLQTLWRPS